MSKLEPQQEKEQEAKPYLDHDLENETITLGNDLVLKINPEGHLPETTDKIVEIADEHDKFLLTNPTLKEQRENNRKAYREILELGLTDFDYDAAIQKVGEKMMWNIGDFLLLYFGEHGGKEGHKLWLTTLNGMLGMQPNGTKA